MKNLNQLMKENNVTDKQMYTKYKAFKIHMNRNHNYGMSMHMAFNTNEMFILAALGLNYLEDALYKVEDPKQRRLFDGDNTLNRSGY